MTPKAILATVLHREVNSSIRNAGIGCQDVDRVRRVNRIIDDRIHSDPVSQVPAPLTAVASTLTKMRAGELEASYCCSTTNRRKS